MRHCKFITDNECCFDLRGSVSEVTSWQTVIWPASMLYLATLVFLKKKIIISEQTFANWEISHKNLVSDFSLKKNKKKKTKKLTALGLHCCVAAISQAGSSLLKMGEGTLQFVSVPNTTCCTPNSLLLCSCLLSAWLLQAFGFATPDPFEEGTGRN